MRRNEARNLIPEDQIGEKAMQEKASTTEANIANIQLDVREFRTDMKAAKEAIADVKVTVVVVDGEVCRRARTYQQPASSSRQSHWNGRGTRGFERSNNAFEKSKIVFVAS